MRSEGSRGTRYTHKAGAVDVQSVTAAVVKESLDRAVEVAKARLTLNAFLGLATVTATGFAVQSQSPNLFFLAAPIPVFALCVDLLAKYRYTSIFLYQAACAELAAGGAEPTTLMLLDFKRAASSKYVQVLRIEDLVIRRTKFRRMYVFSGIWTRILLYGLVVLVELVLGYFATDLVPTMSGALG